MAIESVGLGKLPNVYFEKINLEDHDEKSFDVVSTLVILDELDESSFIWSSDPLLRDFMRVALVETSNLEMVNELNNGAVPHPSILKKLDSWDERTKIHIYGYGDMNKSEDIDDRHFRIKAPLTKLKEASELTLFACAYLDHQEMSNYLHIKLTGSLSRYLGPVASEVVMSGGVLPKTSNIFRKPNGEVFAGPVRQIDGTWYSGEEATDDSVKLKRERVRNSKLTDFRSKTLRDRSKSDMMNVPIFSEAHYSLNSEADLFGIFSMDMKQFVLAKTKFGKAIYGLDDNLFTQVVNSIVLNSVEIRRRQVRFRRQTNRLGSPFYAKEDVMPYRIVGSLEDLKEFKVSNDPFVKTYSFSDLEKNEGDRGEFIYEAAITIVDKTQEYIESILSQIKANLNGLRDVVRRLNHFSNYNDRLDRLNDGETIPDVLNNYIDDYYTYYSMLKDIDDTDLSEMKTMKKSAFNTGNYKRKFGLRFVDEYQSLYDSMHRRFGISPKELRQTKGKPSQSYPPNVIMINKVFEQRVSFSDVESSYDVLGKTDNKDMLVLTKEEFEARGDMEVERFFDPSRAISSEDTFSLDDNDSEALRDIGTPKTLFLAPLSFQFKGDKTDIKKISDVKLDKLSTKFVASRRVKEERKVTSRAKPKTNRKPMKAKTKSMKRRASKKAFKKSRFKFDFRPVAVKINNLSKKKEDYRESVEYMGTNSEFVNIETKTDRSIPANDTEQALTRFAVANEVSVMRSKKEFDVTEKNSLYEKAKTNPKFSAEKLRKIPLATKALLNSRSRAAKNNVHEAESDILKEVDTKVASEMVFHSNQKIEALIGYEKTKMGQPILAKPIWGEITDQMLEEREDILCRLTYVEDATMGINPAPEFKLPVQNQTFIIKGLATVTEPEFMMSDEPEQLPEISEIAFSTTNITRQPRS